MNSYVTVDALKGLGVLNIEGTGNDGRYRQLLESVSRQVDRFTKRHFYTVQESRYFNGPGGTLMLIGDYTHIGSGSILESQNEDGTYNIAWAGSGSGATDWWASPYNANPTSQYDASPYTRLEVNRHSNGTQEAFVKGQRNYQVNGVWGYSNVTVSTDLSAEGSWDATATSLTASGTSLPQIGWTIQAGTERMYVRDRLGQTMTVDRGVNGYAAATHATGAAVSYVDYPAPIHEAVVMQTGRLANRAKGGYTQEMGLPEAGEVVPIIANGLDNDVRQMIGAYRKLLVG